MLKTDAKLCALYLVDSIIKANAAYRPLFKPIMAVILKTAAMVAADRKAISKVLETWKTWPGGAVYPLAFVQEMELLLQFGVRNLPYSIC